jgi:hypothetical protein
MRALLTCASTGPVPSGAEGPPISAPESVRDGAPGRDGPPVLAQNGTSVPDQRPCVAPRPAAASAAVVMAIAVVAGIVVAPSAPPG